MNKPEWMQYKNPYRLVNRTGCFNTVIVDNPAYDAYIKGWEDAQKKLLEYLIKTHAVQFMDIDGHTVSAVLTYHHQSILKQLGNQDAT